MTNTSTDASMTAPARRDTTTSPAERWERFSRAVIAEHRLVADVPGLPGYCTCGEAEFMCRVRSLARKHNLEHVLLGFPPVMPGGAPRPKESHDAAR